MDKVNNEAKDLSYCSLAKDNKCINTAEHNLGCWSCILNNLGPDEYYRDYSEEER